MLDRSLETTEGEVAERVQLFIEGQRSKLLDIIDKLFDLDTLYTASKGDIAFSTLHKLVEEIQTDPAIWSKVGPATKVTLTLPSRLKNQMKNIATIFSKHLAKNPETHDVGQDLAKFLKEFTISDDTNVTTSDDGIFRRLVKAVGLVGHEPELLSPQFRECMARPLSEARQAWFEAVETIFAIAEKILTTRWRNETQRSYRQSCNADEEKIVAEAFSNLLRTWRSQHDEELMTIVRSRSRHEAIYCDVEKEHWQPATEQMKVFKILQSDDGTFSTVLLGAFRLHPGARILKTFTIRTHCVVVVTTSEQGTLVERVDFPLEKPWWGQNFGSVTFTRSFGRPAALCDFNVDDRVIAFVEGLGRVILYRFNETFSSLEIYKRLELGLRTSLTLPATNVLLVDGSLYVTDTNGMIQSVNLRNQQTSQAVHLVPSSSHVGNGSLVVLADNVALGYVAAEDCDGSSEVQHGTLKAVSSEDFRGVPVETSTLLPMNWHDRSLQSFGDLLVAMDTQKILMLRLAVTVRSESFRIQHSKEHSVDGNKRESDTDEDEHWLRVFYHTYEKFPVRGLIRSIDDTRDTLKLHLACSSALTTSAENCCRCFFQTLMRDLRKLNKPLSGMDLARDLIFMTESNAEMDGVTIRPVRSFLQELITFVPIQICRAEANSLTVMTNGKATPINTESYDVQAVDIARSIRFGLLSPLLESWQGRCIVITSMGKQSTGKSYLLNHLTGSSFAIAGARCTDGAWMSIRILPKNVLLIILDFEGLGSFERTEQEDVFLSVLNASISMFTIFRMEMRFDKEIDDLFARFQKGVALIKGDPSLFRGKLYMSVKDVNPNDQKGVLDEFVAKFQTLVGANKDSNFLLDLYSGQLDINCSPPLGTINYYQSLMHAQNFIENDLCGVQTTGFRSGKTFLNCTRLVLAKIAILDWTSLDEGAKQFQLSEVSSKLAGLIRTGCIIPQECISRNDDIAGYLKEDIVLAGNGKVIDVDLVAMIAEYPALGEKWNSLSEFIDLDALSDWTIDLGFDCCSPSDDTILQVHGAIKQLIRLFLRSNTSIHGGKVSSEIVADFDAFLAFIVRRRKARILIWVKQMLGGRVPDEWKAIEHQFLGRFQMLLSRCQSKCDECRFGCMKAAAHPGTAHHDCGGSHVCAGRCEYCESSEQFGKTPPCAKEAGHEGKCECVDGDHTC